MSTVRLRRWTPTTPGERSVIEISREPVKLEQVPQVLRDAASQLSGCSMVIVAVSSARAGDLRAAGRAAESLQLEPHICLAVDDATVVQLQADLKNSSERIGLLLDNVDADTPLSHVMREGVEAIRISPKLALEAGGHLRSACILDALLGIARDAGLCTLGPAVPSRDPSVGATFDYVLDAPFGGPRGTLRPFGAAADLSSR